MNDSCSAFVPFAFPLLLLLLLYLYRYRYLYLPSQSLLSPPLLLFLFLYSNRPASFLLIFLLTLFPWTRLDSIHTAISFSLSLHIHPCLLVILRIDDLTAFRLHVHTPVPNVAAVILNSICPVFLESGTLLCDRSLPFKSYEASTSGYSSKLCALSTDDNLPTVEFPRREILSQDILLDPELEQT
jgi:hypothetical protein